MYFPISGQRSRGFPKFSKTRNRHNWSVFNEISTIGYFIHTCIKKIHVLKSCIFLIRSNGTKIFKKNSKIRVLNTNHVFLTRFHSNISIISFKHVLQLKSSNKCQGWNFSQIPENKKMHVFKNCSRPLRILKFCIYTLKSPNVMEIMSLEVGLLHFRFS